VPPSSGTAPGARDYFKADNGGSNRAESVDIIMPRVSKSGPEILGYLAVAPADGDCEPAGDHRCPRV